MVICDEMKCVGNFGVEFKFGFNVVMQQDQGPFEGPKLKIQKSNWYEINLGMKIDTK